MSQITVDISSTQAFVTVDVARMRQLVERVMIEEAVETASVSVAIVDNATIHRINRDYIHHDWPTDVISFLLSEPDEAELVGEVVISAEMALNTAADLDVNAGDELALYLVHGLLHLCGYEDDQPRGAEIMRARQSEILLLRGSKNAMPPAQYGGPKKQPEENAAWSS
jgi:probable rRNA maturation factor